jgi:membrane protease subunit HflK
MKRILISLIGLILVGVLALASGLCMVAPGEVAVVRRFGRLIEPPWGPGLHWGLPLGIDRLDRVRSDAVRQFTIGHSGPAAVDQEPSSGEVLTGDLNLVQIQATVQYRVANPADYLLRIEQVEPLLVRTAEASLSRSLGHRGIDAVLRSERRRIAEEAQADIQAAVDRLPLGVTILGVSLTDSRPPVEVAAEFAAAQSAESLRDRRINDATTDAAVKLTAASARARSMLDAAHADSERMIQHDRAEAQRFLALATEAGRSRGLTIRRLYIESLQSLLDRVKRKFIMPDGDTPDLTVLGLSGEVAPRSLPAPAPRDPPR